MKRKIMLYVYVFFAWCLFAETEGGTYYIRHLDGSVEIGREEVIPGGISILPSFFRYEVTRKGGEISEVRGYYYQGQFLKFVDTIEKGKLKLSRYFDFTGKEIYRREHEYDDQGYLKEVTILAKEGKIGWSVHLQVTYEDDIIRINGTRVEEIGETKREIVTEEVWTSLWTPLLREGVIRVTGPNGKEEGAFRETYRYTPDGRCSHHILTVEDEKGEAHVIFNEEVVWEDGVITFQRIESDERAGVREYVRRDGSVYGFISILGKRRKSYTVYQNISKGKGWVYWEEMAHQSEEEAIFIGYRMRVSDELILMNAEGVWLQSKLDLDIDPYYAYWDNRSRLYEWKDLLIEGVP